MNQPFFASSIVLALFFAVSCQAMAPESPSKRKTKAGTPPIAESQQSSTSAEGESEFTAEECEAISRAEKGIASPKRAAPVSPKKTLSPKKPREIPPVQLFSTFPKVYFSPGIKDVVVKLIHDEKERIDAAMYRFTLYDVAQAWANARAEKNLQGKLIVDISYQEDFCAALRLLHKNGVPVCCLKATAGQFQTMHHKLLLFYKNSGDKKLVVTGSFNVTGAAHANNYENITISDDPAIFKACENEFARMQSNLRLVLENQMKCMANNKSAQGRALNQIPGDEPN